VGVGYVDMVVVPVDVSVVIVCGAVVSDGVDSRVGVSVDVNPAVVVAVVGAVVVAVERCVADDVVVVDVVRMSVPDGLFAWRDVSTTATTSTTTTTRPATPAATTAPGRSNHSLGGDSGSRSSTSLDTGIHRKGRHARLAPCPATGPVTSPIKAEVNMPDAVVQVAAIPAARSPGALRAN
jgi:hypothetical protein